MQTQLFCVNPGEKHKMALNALQMLQADRPRYPGSKWKMGRNGISTSYSNADQHHASRIHQRRAKYHILANKTIFVQQKQAVILSFGKPSGIYRLCYKYLALYLTGLVIIR